MCFELINPLCPFFFFFFNDTATTEIYTLSLHDALPICCAATYVRDPAVLLRAFRPGRGRRSEEHTSELQSRPHLVCRLLLEKKKNKQFNNLIHSKHYASFTCINITPKNDTNTIMSPMLT